MKKRHKTVPLFIENGDGSFRINPAYSGKEKIICGKGKQNNATSVYALNPEIHRAEASALAKVYERRDRHLDELLRNGGQVVHVKITEEEKNPQVVHVTVLEPHDK